MLLCSHRSEARPSADSRGWCDTHRVGQASDRLAAADEEAVGKKLLGFVAEEAAGVADREVTRLAGERQDRGALTDRDNRGALFLNC